MKFHEDSRHVLKGKSAIYNYIHGAHGALTLKSPSGKHHTYTFHPPYGSENKRFYSDVFVYCVTQANHEACVGVINSRGFWHIKTSKFSASSEVFKGANYLYQMACKDFDTPMEVYHEGICGCCGRKLTHPDSIERGVGPSCFRKMPIDLWRAYHG